MPTISSADRANEAALTTNATSRPSVAATTPPSAAPTASMTPQVEPISTLASGRSSSSTRFGSEAELVGSNTAAPRDRPAAATNAIHSVPGSRASRKARATGTRARSAATISRRRSYRSASTPAIGEATANAPVCTTSISAATLGEPVSSRARPSSATVANQSPAKLTS
jgi:hypothetical protein